MLSPASRMVDIVTTAGTDTIIRSGVHGENRPVPSIALTKNQKYAEQIRDPVYTVYSTYGRSTYSSSAVVVVVGR